jgi:tryptophanyl-tRNA synthetase
VPCLIPCGIDQDPHFRVARDIAPTLGYYKPALLHNKMFPGLQGTDKMSSSQPNSTIYTTDPPKLVRKKIMSAFTGGAVSVEEQRKTGGRPEVCSVFKYKFYLFERNDKKLDELYDRCRKGDILCGECKKELADNIVQFIEEHQLKREQAKEKVEEFMLRDCDGS